MARVNLYVSDELWDRAKGLNAVNWSQEFQAAVQRKLGDNSPIQMEVRAMQAELEKAYGDQVNNAAQTLRWDFIVKRQELYKVGYALGVEWAPYVSYSTYRYCESSEWHPKQTLNSVASDHGEAFWEDLNEKYQSDEQMPENRGLIHIPEAVETDIAHGFSDALRSVWERTLIVGEDEEE